VSRGVSDYCAEMGYVLPDGLTERNGRGGSVQFPRAEP
jgi:hypothetical protein